MSRPGGMGVRGAAARPPPPGPPAAPAHFRLVPEGWKAGVGRQMAAGRDEGETGREDGPFGGGALRRESACARARVGPRAGCAVARGLGASGPAPVCPREAAPGSAPARWAAVCWVGSGLRTGRPCLRHCASVSICVSVHALLLFLESKFLEELLSLPAVTWLTSGPTSLLSAAGGLGLSRHGAAPRPSRPPAHTAAPASPSELRYTPVHPLAKHFWPSPPPSPHLGFGYPLQAPEHQSWLPLTHLPTVRRTWVLRLLVCCPAVTGSRAGHRPVPPLPQLSAEPPAVFQVGGNWHPKLMVRPGPSWHFGRTSGTPSPAGCQGGLEPPDWPGT